ncbi:MAG: hypothetical protein HZC41_20655 [Chloroflexi bacterium]|nr:hypothetical protein [Chloroflexota bacterium]
MSGMWSNVRTRLGWLAIGSALFSGMIAGIFIPQVTAQAQDAEPQTYTVLAGGADVFNTAVLAFAPQSLKVHRGDTVQWLISGFHNIHFAETPTELIIAPEVNGQPLPQMNPAVAFPNIENGGVFQGGDANSGIGLDPTNPTVTFSLVMDVEPGTYTYVCDIHPGMVATITVVDDATAIPAPAEVLATGAAEQAMNAGTGVQAAVKAAMQPPSGAENGEQQVKAGLQPGVAAVLQFFPSISVIEAGQSVTWSVPPGMEPHTVTWPPPPPGSDFTLIPQDAGNPILALGEAAFPSAESGAEIGTGDNFNSGIMMPGQSYTLKFTEPGVYNYICFLHPGMQGAVVVMPSS